MINIVKSTTGGLRSGAWVLFCMGLMSPSIGYAGEPADAHLGVTSERPVMPVYRADSEDRKRDWVDHREDLEMGPAHTPVPVVAQAEVVTGLPVRTVVWNDEMRQIKDRIPQAYVRPSAAESQSFKSVIQNVLDKNYGAAKSSAEALGYSLEEVRSEADGFRAVALREGKDASGRMRGWGSYFFNLSISASDVIVEAPHPIDDIGTPELAAGVFGQSNARVYLLSGSDRDHADAAHDAGMIFNDVHTAVSARWSRAIVCQIHGFSLAKHPSLPSGTQAVISNVDGTVADVSAQVDTALRSKGIRGFVYNRLPAHHPRNQELNEGRAGEDFSDLAATTNLQWDTTRPHSGKFVHIEFSYDVRSTSALSQRVSSAVASALKRSLQNSAR